MILVGQDIPAQEGLRVRLVDDQVQSEQYPAAALCSRAFASILSPICLGWPKAISSHSTKAAAASRAVSEAHAAL